MEYDIKLSGTPFDDGSMDLDQLERLAWQLRNIAKGALQMRIFGTSVRKGRENERLSAALKIRLRGLTKGSTVLHVACAPFGETLRGHVQGNLFQENVLQQLPDQTPMTLVMEAFQDALNPNYNGDLLDTALLKDLQNFQKVFVNDAQHIQLSNRGSLPDVDLSKNTLSKLLKWEDQIPKPQKIIAAGRVEELKYSKARVTFLPDQGRPFVGFLGESVPHAEMATLWGEKATIIGMAHYKANGQMAHVEIEHVHLAQDKDNYFSRVPRRETVAQQLERQLKEGKGRSSTILRLSHQLAEETWETSLEEDLKLLN